MYNKKLIFDSIFDLFWFILQALLYFVHVMDHITVKEYVMVYFHTLTGVHNHLDSNFLKNLYDIVDVKSV